MIQKNKLAIEFYQEITKTIDYIRENPGYFQKRYKDFKMTFTKKFPYGVIYTVENKNIFIHAILHTSQKFPK